MGEQVKRCVVVGSAPYADSERLRTYLRDSDYVIAADGGQKLLAEMGRIPDLAVGDFDSSCLPNTDIPVRTLPTQKDDTDVLAALRIGLDNGFRDFLLLGCLGGRLDHTLSNVMLLAFLQQHGAAGVLVDECHEVRLLKPGKYTIPPRAGTFLSLLAFGGKVDGVTLKNVAYPLENATFDTTFPYGVSNEFTHENAQISFSKGQLLMIFAKES